MIPWSSPRSSGWRATDWIIDPKTTPMPMPAPSEPSPMPSPKPSALAAFKMSDAARTRCTSSSLVRGLDRRADGDGSENREDEGLNRHDDDHLEDVEGHADEERHGHGDPECQAAPDEEKAGS